MPTMNVSLTEEMVRFVEGEVARGEYVSASEVVRDALRVLRHDKETAEAELALLRAEVQKGIDDADNGRYSQRSIKEIAQAVLRNRS